MGDSESPEIPQLGFARFNRMISRQLWLRTSSEFSVDFRRNIRRGKLDIFVGYWDTLLSRTPGCRPTMTLPNPYRSRSRSRCINNASSASTDSRNMASVLAFRLKRCFECC